MPWYWITYIIIAIALILLLNWVASTQRAAMTIVGIFWPICLVYVFVLALIGTVTPTPNKHSKKQTKKWREFYKSKGYEDPRDFGIETDKK